MYEDRLTNSKKHQEFHINNDKNAQHNSEYDPPQFGDDNYLKLQRENHKLRTSLKDLQNKMMAMTSTKDNEDSDVHKRLQEYKDKMNHMSQYVAGLETELESCQKNLSFLQDVLKQQIVGGIESTEELLAELDKVEDPFAIVLINRIINTYNKKEGSSKNSFKTRQHSGKDKDAGLYRALEDYQKRAKKLELENKALNEEIETFRTQNDFLVNQLDFAQKQLEYKSRRSHNSASSQPDTIVAQICEIFGIRDQERILESVEKILVAYQYLPSLQNTIEKIYTIVTEKSCVQVECTSNEQLVEIIDNWASNLQDYQNLVVELFDVMNIKKEDHKNRTHLIHSIKQMMEERDDIENSVIGNSDIVDELKRLKKQVMGIEFFVDEAKQKLGLDESYSNEALFSKILKALDKLNEGGNKTDHIGE